MERLYVKVLSGILRTFKFKGSYRVAKMLYPNDSSFFKGINLTIPYLKKEHNLKLNISSKNLIDHKILFTGEYEKETKDFLNAEVKAGMIVLEAGANTGTETLLLSKLVGTKGKVYAFEPVPFIFNKLDKNISVNGLQNVVHEQLAIGESEQEISFFVADENYTNQGLSSKKAGVHSKLQKKITVNQVTIDNYLERMGVERLDFIKMDIQGAEFDLLKGAEKTFKKFHPKIFLEAYDNWSPLKEILDWFETMEYDVFVLSNNMKPTKVVSNNYKEGNWIATFKG